MCKAQKPWLSRAELGAGLAQEAGCWHRGVHGEQGAPVRYGIVQRRALLRVGGVRIVAHRDEVLCRFKVAVPEVQD